MAKRVTPTGKTRAKRRAPIRAKQASAVSRRAFLAGGGVLAAGIGIGDLIGHWVKPGVAPAPVPAEHIASLQTALPAMEEEPLPADVYIQPAPAAIAPALPAAPTLAAHAAPPPTALAPAVPAATQPAPPAPAPRIVETTPHWQRNARPFVAAGGRPVIAVVIDDLGLDHARSERALGLDHAVTTAFMTYAEKLPQWLARARAGRHELLVHVPMQPEAASVDPGPNALTIALSQDEILRRLRWGLDRMDGYVGANNHMGSRFTEDAAGMRVVLAELKARGLLFLDSRTTPHSACGPVAASLGIPFASRNVFLDNETTVSAVRQQILTLEAVAHKHGTAIGIGHPHDATLTALAEWLPVAQSRGFAVVPLTSAMRHAAERA